MSLRHHYSVTRTGPEPVERWFHTFGEADAFFSELADASQKEGLTPVGQSYWRKAYTGPEDREVVLALDDRGLSTCNAGCGS